jgi:hypothetical protein
MMKLAALLVSLLLAKSGSFDVRSETAVQNSHGSMKHETRTNAAAGMFGAARKLHTSHEVALGCRDEVLDVSVEVLLCALPGVWVVRK